MNDFSAEKVAKKAERELRGILKANLYDSEQMIKY